MGNHRKLLCGMSALAAGFLLPSPAEAGVTIEDGDTALEVGAQLRIRHQSPPFPANEDLPRFTNYRARLNLDFQADNGFRIFLQPQKVGVFGDNDTGAAVDFNRTPANQSLHQAFLDWPLNDQLDLRLGRFEQHLADHRLIGDFRWSNRARSFDGGRLRWSAGNHQVSLFALQLAGEDYGGNAGGPLPVGDADADQQAYVAHFRNDALVPASRLELTYVYDDDLQGTPFSASRLEHGPGGLPASERHTGGFFLARTDSGGSFLSPFLGRTLKYPKDPGLYWRLEGYLQRGDMGPSRAGQDIDAYMAAGYLGYGLGNVPGRPLVWGGVDYLSGDRDASTGDYEAFSTLYSTNHPYYGYMDYFLISPDANTNGHGLRDAHLSLHLKPAKRLGVWLKGHNFALADAPGGTDDALGNEVDLTVAYKAHPRAVLLLGYSKFFSDDGMHDLGRIESDEDPNFLYGMVNASF
ncbi:hypothetical protein AN478_05985 [Thiohalorhabdus denitrificans]|uniref:Alginate export n=1 Tax=Thiohalorhabdus denitrificans TaxID=381306 RepID=A0A0P9CCU4_9GAMM|nr:alginate export family protein [Thiohalorhabdus denitrificans]KPV40704.1 hypothetical protein AN478_05985 [Thiohalorhabdus denitrificans]SCY46512.1 Alginate export [Thiohalorhabdus denitrificans]